MCEEDFVIKFDLKLKGEKYFEQIKNITDIPIDHSFLKYKKELTKYGYQVGKISMKQKTVTFHKIIIEK